MGKTRIIKSLGRVIGNIVIHKILVEHTNKPESIPKLKNEVGTYRENALSIATEFNWNQAEKDRIATEVLKNFTRDMKEYYPDVSYPSSQINNLIDETIKEMID